MSGRDWRAFDAELRARVPELAVELLGKPTFRAGQEWRWGRKGSLSVVISGARAGMWFDHEEGRGGWFSDLVGRDLGMASEDATDWIADRIGMGARHRPVRQRPAPREMPANDLAVPPSAPGTESSETRVDHDGDAAPTRADEDAARAARIWTGARPAPEHYPYLVAKQAAPLALRMDARHRLVVPLQDIDGRIHSLETIAPDGAKRFLAGGAKKGHFALVGFDPAPLAEPAGPVLICEGWATGASLHIATGHTVIAAMDSGNLMPVAEALRARFSDADLVLVADNDVKPDRDGNPGVDAARKVALAIDGRLAVPENPGDANDLFCAEGPDAVAAVVAGAAKIPPPPPTYPVPFLTPEEARTSLADAIAGFMAAIPDYWAAVAAAQEEATKPDTDRDPLDFNIVERAALPPLLGLPVDVGLGKTSSARAAIAELIGSGGLGTRKVVYAVPRHDLGVEQVTELKALGLSAMLWKGRTAPDPTDDNPDRLMCLDTEAIRRAQVQIVALVFTDDVDFDTRPMTCVDGGAIGCEVDCDLEEAAVVLEAHIATHVNRFPVLHDLAQHRAVREPAHDAVGDQFPRGAVARTRRRLAQVVDYIGRCGQASAPSETRRDHRGRQDHGCAPVDHCGPPIRITLGPDRK